MFAGPYGVSEDGTYSEWIAVRGDDLCPIPGNIDDATAAGMPVAYLTAQITLMQAGFAPGKIVLAPAIGGAVGNAVTQLARAQGAGKAISTTTSPAKAKQARSLGFEHVIDLSAESLADGVARITKGRGVDVVIESVGGALTGQALGTLALNGVLTTLGYSAGRKTTIDVTDLIWKRASMSGFSPLAAATPELLAAVLRVPRLDEGLRDAWGPRIPALPPSSYHRHMMMVRPEELAPTAADGVGTTRNERN